MEQVLKQIKITYFNRNKVLRSNKVGSIVEIDIVKNMKMTKMTLVGMYSTFF